MKALLLVLAAASVALLAGCCGRRRTGRAAARPVAGHQPLADADRAPLRRLRPRPGVDVIVDREKLDPDGVQASLDFLPYRIQKGVTRSREDFSHFTRLRWEATLRCITIACVPSRLQSVLGGQEGRGERRTYSFKPARITYEDPKTGKVSRLRQVFWPPLDAISRLSPDAQEIPSYASLGPGGEFGATLAPVDEPTFRAPAWLVGGAAPRRRAGAARAARDADRARGAQAPAGTAVRRSSCRRWSGAAARRAHARPR